MNLFRAGGCRLRCGRYGFMCCCDTSGVFMDVDKGVEEVAVG